jgi:hypothetical protein
MEPGGLYGEIAALPVTWLRFLTLRLPKSLLFSEVIANYLKYIDIFIFSGGSGVH